jgi:hypothetical protein
MVASQYVVAIRLKKGYYSVTVFIVNSGLVIMHDCSGFLLKMQDKYFHISGIGTTVNNVITHCYTTTINPWAGRFNRYHTDLSNYLIIIFSTTRRLEETGWAHSCHHPIVVRTHCYHDPIVISIPQLSRSHYCLDPTAVTIPLLSRSHSCHDPIVVSIPRLSRSHSCHDPIVVTIPLLS